MLPLKMLPFYQHGSSDVGISTKTKRGRTSRSRSRRRDRISSSGRAARAAPRGKHRHQDRSLPGRNKCNHGNSRHSAKFALPTSRSSPNSQGEERSPRSGGGRTRGVVREEPREPLWGPFRGQKKEATGSSSFEGPLFSSKKNASWSTSVLITTVKNREEANGGTIKTFPGRQAVKTPSCQLLCQLT